MPVRDRSWRTAAVLWLALWAGLVAGAVQAGGLAARRAGLEITGVACDAAGVKVDGQAIRVSLADRAAQRPIPPEFLGTNILYWIDDDAGWAGGQEQARLRRLGLKTLRYPGGEVADNYDWETHSIERGNSFPREANSEAGREARLDYREFLAHARKIGAENLFFVVNLEGAFFRPGDPRENVARYADKAARWVKAVRDAGYFVPNWEIGNESYIRTAYPLRAREYAWALKQFHQKMKAADPRIRIGAIGPFTARGEDAVGFADFLGDEALAAYRRALRDGNDEPCRDETKWNCAKALGGTPAGQGKAEKWWDVVLSEAGDSFDYAVIHRYRSARITRDKQVRFEGPIPLAGELREFKRYLRERKGREVMLALTEWNTPAPFHNAMSDMQHAMDVLEQLGNYLEGGVDYALYWPWRMKGNKFPLVGENWAGKSTFELMALFQEYHGPDLLAAGASPHDDVYLLATRDAGARHYLFVNHGATERRVHIDLNGTEPAKMSWKVLSESEDGLLAADSGSRAAPSGACGLGLRLAPSTISGITLKGR